MPNSDERLLILDLGHIDVTSHEECRERVNTLNPRSPTISNRPTAPYTQSALEKKRFSPLDAHKLLHKERQASA